MTDFTTLERRFYIRHLPEALSARTEHERQQVLADALNHHPFSWFQDHAMAFFADAAPDLHHREVLTRLLGVGKDRLYHIEHNLTDVPMLEMPTLHAMIARLATINAHLMAEDDPDFNRAAYIAEKQENFNLWLSDLRHGALRFMVVNSIRMEHSFLAHEMVDDAIDALIPRKVEIQDGEEGFQVHVHVEDALHQKIWREMTRRGLARVNLWTNRMDETANAMGHPQDTVAVQEKIDHHGYPMTTYALFSSTTNAKLRLDHWGMDIEPLPKADLPSHLEALRTQFELPIRDDVTALYHALIQETQDSEVTPLYTRDTGNKVFLSPNMFDKP